MIEQQLMQKRARLMGKLPETQRALDAVNLLIQKREADQSVCLSRRTTKCRVTRVCDLISQK